MKFFFFIYGKKYILPHRIEFYKNKYLIYVLQCLYAAETIYQETTKKRQSAENSTNMHEFFSEYPLRSFTRNLEVVGIYRQPKPCEYLCTNGKMHFKKDQENEGNKKEQKRRAWYFLQKKHRMHVNLYQHGRKEGSSMYLY